MSTNDEHNGLLDILEGIVRNNWPPLGDGAYAGRNANDEAIAEQLSKYRPETWERTPHGVQYHPEPHEHEDDSGEGEP